VVVVALSYELIEDGRLAGIDLLKEAPNQLLVLL
jgi:hypothetical protein